MNIITIFIDQIGMVVAGKYHGSRPASGFIGNFRTLVSDDGSGITIKSNDCGNRILGYHLSGFSNGCIVPGDIDLALHGDQPFLLIDHGFSRSTL